MTLASNKLAKAQEVAALKGLRAAAPFFVQATEELAAEKRYDAAVGVLAEVLNAREKKRGLFRSKETNPLGPERANVGKQFAKLTRHAQINDSILELLCAVAAENPDDPLTRLACAEGLYRGGYMADAIDEYRYCEKMMPDDGALVARLGELFAIMSRNSEAVDHLRRGIGELMQAQRFDEVPAFALKLFEVDPQSANDVQRWMESLADEALSRKRGDVARVLGAVREAGLDDGRWSSLEQRLAALPPPAEEPEPEFAAYDEPWAEPQASAQSERQPILGSQSAPTPTRSAWDDPSSVEPASEDEMRMLLGPTASDASAAHEVPTVSANGVAPAASVSLPPPSAAPGLPPGLAAFTRRKADAAVKAGDFAGAAASYERLVKAGFDAEVASPLIECYLGLQRFSDAARLALQLADHQASAGELDKAVATLALILEHTSDPDVERRHSELLTAKS